MCYLFLNHIWLWVFVVVCLVFLFVCFFVLISHGTVIYAAFVLKVMV